MSCRELPKSRTFFCHFVDFIQPEDQFRAPRNRCHGHAIRRQVEFHRRPSWVPIQYCWIEYFTSFLRLFTIQILEHEDRWLFKWSMTLPRKSPVVVFERKIPCQIETPLKIVTHLFTDSWMKSFEEPMKWLVKVWIVCRTSQLFCAFVIATVQTWLFMILLWVGFLLLIDEQLRRDSDWEVMSSWAMKFDKWWWN